MTAPAGAGFKEGAAAYKREAVATVGEGLVTGITVGTAILTITVESFTTVDLSGNFDFNDHWKAGVHVANLFGDEHWEAFGADVLERRALAHLTFAW